MCVCVCVCVLASVCVFVCVCVYIYHVEQAVNEICHRDHVPPIGTVRDVGINMLAGPVVLATGCTRSSLWKARNEGSQ